MMAHELSEKLSQAVSFDFSALRALDSAIRSRAVLALTSAGVSLAEALHILGLDED